jgi:tetratricopeptide (TPR) repeat protein
MIATENEINAQQTNAYVQCDAPAMVVELLTLAVNCHRDGQLSEAENHYREILSIDPLQPNANHNLGVLALDSDQPNLSLDFFRVALDNDPDEPQFWISYVDALIQADQHQYAREVLINGLELGLHGDEVNALVNKLAKVQTPQPVLPQILTAQAIPQNIQALIAQPKKPVAQTSKNQNDWHKNYPNNSAIKEAVLLQQSGKFVEAKAKFTKLLKFHPKHPVILTCLGMINLAMGEILEGKTLLEESLNLEPNQSTVLSNLSIAYSKLNLFDAAVKSAEDAIALNPNYGEAHVNRGNALKELNRFGDAVVSYKKAIEIKKDDQDAHFNLGCLLVQLKHHKDAVPVLTKCVELNPKDAEAHQFLADALVELKEFENALNHYDQAIKINAKNFKAFFGRGFVNLALNKNDEARADFERVIHYNPEYNQAYMNLACALHKLGKVDEAVHINEVLIKRDFDLTHVLNNHGLYLQDLQCLDEALVCFNQAAELDKNQYESHWNIALLKLLSGEFEEGWQCYESRWNTILKEAKRAYNQPLWLGNEDLSGKTLLIYPEQGFGDFIQFCRYIPMVEALGAKVVLEVPKPLHALLATLKGNFTMVTQGASLPPFEYQCPMMSLPLAFKTTLVNIPANIPYLFSDQEKALEWQQKLGEKGQLRVGLVWSGSSGHKKDQDRSIPLEKFKSLFSLPVEFHTLQKEFRESDLKALDELTLINRHEEALSDFSSTAALIENLDLVISVDTSVAHLAAAMGKSCWLLLPYAPDFRWMLDRDESPWYPTMTLFRQAEGRDWMSVLNQVKARLEAHLGAV